MKEIEELQEKVTINEMIDVLLLDQLNAIYHQHGSQSNYYAERRDSTRFALLSRFRELQKYKDTFYTLWDFCSEQTHKQIELVKRAEQAEEQVERLRCCGNCKHYEYDMEEDHYYCSKNISHGKRHAGICSSNWTFERK